MLDPKKNITDSKKKEKSDGKYLYERRKTDESDVSFVIANKTATSVFLVAARPGSIRSTKAHEKPLSDITYCLYDLFCLAIGINEVALEGITTKVNHGRVSFCRRVDPSTKNQIQF